MVDFVCGTLFGSRSGRVHDIVIDWISSLKGWKARIVRGEDGVRRLRWEATGETGRFAEMPIDTEPAEGIDAEAIRVRVDETLTRVARKIRVEKPKTALLLYATAMDVSLTESVVLDALGVGKSMAYRLRDRAMAELRACCARLEEADDPIFGRLLLEACEAGLETAVRQALGGGDGVGFKCQDWRGSRVGRRERAVVGSGRRGPGLGRVARRAGVALPGAGQ